MGGGGAGDPRVCCSKRFLLDFGSLKCHAQVHVFEVTHFPWMRIILSI